MLPKLEFVAVKLPVFFNIQLISVHNFSPFGEACIKNVPYFYFVGLLCRFFKTVWLLFTHFSSRPEK